MLSSYLIVLAEKAEEQSDGVTDEEQEAGVDDDERATAVPGRAEGNVDEAVEAAGETHGRQCKLDAAAPMGPTGVGPGPRNRKSQNIMRDKPFSIKISENGFDSFIIVECHALERCRR